MISLASLGSSLARSSLEFFLRGLPGSRQRLQYAVIERDVVEFRHRRLPA